jgi:PAS domain S-box-containing protein
MPIAALVHDPVLAEERELVDAVTAAASLAIQNERLTAEARAQYAFLEAITDTVPSLLVNVATDGRIQEQNPAALAAAGFEDEELVRGRFFWDVFIDDDERHAMVARFRAAAPDFPPGEYENTFTNALGEERVVYWRSAPVHDETGAVVSIVAGGLDVTERKRQEAEIIASRARIVRAEDEARRRLERNLHDGAQQRLVSLAVSLRLVESKLHEDTQAASEVLNAAREELTQALEELRELARGIHPAVLSDRGLAPALQSLVGRAPLPVELQVETDGLEPDVEAAAYYVVAEALTNVAKYGRASSATVRIAARNGSLEVTVVDDGVGGADPGKGSGLRGLADRVEALCGDLEVESQPGAGTTVSARIPLSS